jgi:hypothetical protein
MPLVPYLRLYVRNIGLLCDAMRELNAELGG